MKILYTDGGCSRNWQKDPELRKMISVVTDDSGKPLVEKKNWGGSNNIAELLAVKEALMWALNNGYKEVEVRTDSRNNFAWVFGKKLGEKLNDRAAVINLKTAIQALRQDVKLNLVWVPREENLAGFYIEQKHSL
jgi:ribonuclease HI